MFLWQRCFQNDLHSHICENSPKLCITYAGQVFGAAILLVHWCVCRICCVCKIRLCCWSQCELNPYFSDEALANTLATKYKAMYFTFVVCLSALSFNPHFHKHVICTRMTSLFLKARFWVAFLKTSTLEPVFGPKNAVV